VVTDSRSPRDGRFIEQIGTYDPKRAPAAFAIDQLRLQHWLAQGARTTDTLRRLILKNKPETPPAAS
jgi:small subunit ribosomal protein S16